MPLTDAAFAAQQARILRLTVKWRDILGLHLWRLTPHYFRGDFPSPEAHAQTTVRWDYLEVAIEWNVPTVADLDDERLEYAVVHELMHVVVNEMRPDEQSVAERRHEERVVSTLACAAGWIWEAATRAAAPDWLRLNG